MRRSLVWLALLPPLAGLGQMQPVQAQADAQAAQKEIQGIYDRWRDAWKRKDINAIMAPFAPDYLYTWTNGQVRNRRQTENDYKGTLKSIKSIESLSISAGKVTVKGNEASNICIWRSTGVSIDPQGKHHPSTSHFDTRDTFVKTRKGWVFKRSLDVRAVVTVDGKPVADPYDPFGAAKKPKK